MKYAIVQLEEEGITSYNLEIFKKEEEVIAFPYESLQTEILRLKYYLEKADYRAQNVMKGRVKYKKKEIRKSGDELVKARKTMKSIMQFELQTSLEDFNWPPLKIKKRKRLSAYKKDNNLKMT